MPFATNEGAQIYWEEEGRGAPLVMIMGLGFGLRMWFRLRPEFARHYRLILLDNRGVGLSSRPTGRYSIQQMARDTRAVMNAAGVIRAHVMGASMGGMIAQELALLEPDRVASLLLGCTTPGGLGFCWPHWNTLRELWRSRPAHSPADEIRALAPILYHPGTAPQLIEEDALVHGSVPRDTHAYRKQVAGLLQWSSLGRLSRLRMPVLVVHGDSDRLVVTANGRAIAERVTHARLALLPQAGHILSTDQTELTLAAALDFLREVDGQ